MNYLDRPIFEFEIDWTRLPSTGFEYDLRALEIGFGPPAFAPLQDDVVHGFQFEVLLQDPDAIAAIESFFDAIKGRLQGFWLPGPQEAFHIVDFVGVTAGTIEIDAVEPTLSGTLTGVELAQIDGQTGALIEGGCAATIDAAAFTATVTLP